MSTAPEAPAGGVTSSGGVTSVGGVTSAGAITSSGGVTSAGGITSSGGVTSAGGITSAGSTGEKFLSCWSCRLLSGGGLLLSAAYVFNAARRSQIGRVPAIGMMVQISFALCLASLGVVIIADPIQKKDLKSA